MKFHVRSCVDFDGKGMRMEGGSGSRDLSEMFSSGMLFDKQPGELPLRYSSLSY